MSALCVLETGACTSVGMSAASAAAAVRCGLSNFEEHGSAVDRFGDPAIVSSPPGLGTSVTGETIRDLAVEALSSLNFTGVDDARHNASVFLSLPEPRPGLPEDIAEQVAHTIVDKFGLRVARPSAFGHAAGGVAFNDAGSYLVSRSDEVAIVLGLDSYLNIETLKWLDEGRQLHASYNAWGFIPGAAASASIVCNPKFSKQRRIQPAALIERISVETEAAPIKSEDVCLGRAMSNVVETLGLGEATELIFDNFYCDLNGEAYRSDEIGFMLSRVNGAFRDPTEFIAPADCWGDVGAASLPLYVTLATQAAERGYAAGPLSILLAGSESGLRAGIRLRTMDT